MSRNEFEVSHFCSQVNQQVEFKVLIGSLPICPECRQVVDQPEGYSTGDELFKKQDSGKAKEDVCL